MRATSPGIHFPSLLQFAMSGLGLMVTLPLAALLAWSGGISLLRDGEAASVALPLALAATALAVSALLIPSLVLPVLRLLGQPLPRLGVPNGLRFASVLMLFWPLVIGGGWWLSQNSAVAGVFLPFLQVLAIGLPILWLVEAGRWRLDGGSGQRTWGLTGFSVLVNPLLVIALEGLVMMVLIAAFALWASTQPALVDEFARLFERLEQVGNDPQALMGLLSPYLQRRGVLFSVIALVAVVMPVLEELLKPLALWFVAGRLRAPAEGFVAGLICGGAFAFVESLGYASSVDSATWAQLVSVRAGSGLLHVVTSGLVGWGLGLAWLRGRTLALAGLYLLAVLLHGLWNLLGVLAGVAALAPVSQFAPDLPVRAEVLLPAALLVLAATMFMILLGVNGRLRAARGTPADLPQLNG